MNFFDFTFFPHLRNKTNLIPLKENSQYLINISQLAVNVLAKFQQQTCRIFVENMQTEEK